MANNLKEASLYQPKRIKSKDCELHKCPECGLLYKERKWAEKCEEWCKRYKSCNLKITKHAIRKGGEKNA